MSHSCEGSRSSPKPVVYIAVQGSRSGPLLAKAMVAQSTRVVLLADAESRAHAEFLAGFDVIDTGFASRGEVNAAFEAAAKLAGPPDQVLVNILPRHATKPRPIGETSDAEWQVDCKAVIRATLYCVQVAGACMKDGSIVVIGPAFTLCGSASLVPLSTATEAQRGSAFA